MLLLHGPNIYVGVFAFVHFAFVFALFVSLAVTVMFRGPAAAAAPILITSTFLFPQDLLHTGKERKQVRSV